MTELMEKVVTLEKKIDQLTLIIMKDKNDTTWVSEEEAAQMLGYKDQRTLRKKVKAGVFPFSLIAYRNSNGRCYQYSRKSIMKFKETTSTN